MINEDFYFEKLRKKIAKEIDFQGQYYGEKHLKRRFMVRLRALDITTFRDYIRYLDRNPSEYEILKMVLPVNVTEWFRNPETFQYLKDEILPAIIREKEAASKRIIRVWSAGCSDGKEPYTMAMLFHELLGDDIERKHIRIIASDIDEEELDKGREGLYSETEMKGLDEMYRERFFTKEDGGYRVKPCLMSMVLFEKRDLIKDEKPSRMDLILCRNVVIYFTSELKERLYQEFFNSLAPGGYFVMGKTETLLGDARNLFVPIDNRERVYQRPP
jgi:chemotaxis protein methyltransferase CheR